MEWLRVRLAAWKAINNKQSYRHQPGTSTMIQPEKSLTIFSSGRKVQAIPPHIVL